MNKFENISTFFLLVELLHDGSAGTIEDLVQYEPIMNEEIVDELSIRANINIGNSYSNWKEWYFESSSVTENEKKTLRLIESMKEDRDYYVRKIQSKE